MGDQGRWFKLWVTAPYDIHLSNLSLEDFARWCLFGVYLKVHGNNGVLEITSPATSLQQLFRVHDHAEMMQVITRFPSTKITVTSVTTATVTWCNWLKYQGDFSGDRVRKFRCVKRTKKRGEEKRREENKTTPLTPQKGGDRFNEFWLLYPRKVCKRKTEQAWKKLQVENGLFEKIISSLQTQVLSDQWLRDNGQYIPHPTTWLNGRRWEDEPPGKTKSWREG